jgi:hypothetical protein
MVSQTLIVLSLLVVPAASVEQKVDIFEGKLAACYLLDTTYTGVDLTTGTSCKKVTKVSPKGEVKGTVALKYTGSQKALKFKVHDTCDDIDGATVVVVEANETESAKILAGECGEVASYFGDDQGQHQVHDDVGHIRMYMKISNSSAPTTGTAISAAESTDMVMPMVLVVLARMLLAY